MCIECHFNMWCTDYHLTYATLCTNQCDHAVLVHYTCTCIQHYIHTSTGPEALLLFLPESTPKERVNVTHTIYIIVTSHNIFNIKVVLYI